MIVRPWKPGDSERVLLQPSQRYSGDLADVSQDLTPLSDAGLAWTVEAGNEVICCAGLLPQWSGRAVAWALVSQDAGAHFAAIHRAVKRFLDVSEFRRIEAHVDVDFPQGARWMKMLGFEFEARMRGFRPDGADMLLFARVR